MKGKYVDKGVYCDITYIEKRIRRIESNRKHLMKIISDCIKTPAKDNKCKGCINEFRIHSVKGLIDCKNDRTEWNED